MNKMSARLDLVSGRTDQKLRTKTALIAAARQLIAAGATPTLEEAALAARISRTTAYRYFASQAELLAAAHPEIEQTSLLPAGAPLGAEERLEIVVEHFTKIVRATETQQRTMLRLSLDPSASGPLLLRQGRAIGWIEDALSPLQGRMGQAELRRLVLAIRSAIGIEAFVWLVDVAKLSRTEAVKTMRWSAQALLRTAIAESRGRSASTR